MTPRIETYIPRLSGYFIFYTKRNQESSTRKMIAKMENEAQQVPQQAQSIGCYVDHGAIAKFASSKTLPELEKE